MNLKQLANLLDTSNNINYFRKKIQENENVLFDKLENDETLFHVLVRSKKIKDSLKNRYIYILCDAGIDINWQNKTNQTCLHIAVINGSLDILNSLLQCASDLTIVDNSGLCAYNYARRLKDKELSKKIILIMQPYYPTYWIGIENEDMNVIRRLVNSWCRFKVKKNGKYIADYVKERGFLAAIVLFSSLEIQMDLCFAVLAGNVKKVQFLIDNHKSELLLNFKNMKEKGATVLSYAIKENNYEILKAFLEFKPNVLSEYELDDRDIDYPIYFAALKENLDLKCMELITPVIDDPKKPNIANLFYKSSSVLRYCISIGVNIDVLESIMNPKYCGKELITVRDAEFLTSLEYTQQNNLDEYENFIKKLTINYILNNQKFRKQMALNGFNFSEFKIENDDLLTLAQKNEMPELCCFLENVDLYQKKIKEFHKAVEDNSYHDVKAKSDIELKLDGFKTEEIFFTNLTESKLYNESQSVFHKAVLHGYFNILEALLESYIESEIKISPKLDQMRDHCFRTPMHYACGFVDNKRMIQLLSHFGFSLNVFDKDGNTPLDFQERAPSDEVQNLLILHKKQAYETEEPNPWTWQVWTSVQREKNGLRQLISPTHPNIHGHGHSHGGHGHSHGGHGHSYGQSHSHDASGACVSDHDNDQCGHQQIDNSQVYCNIL